MCNDNCIYCEQRQLTYDILSASKVNAMQAEVIEHLLVERDFYADEAERLRAGLTQLKQYHKHGCSVFWPNGSASWTGVWGVIPQVTTYHSLCNCGADWLNGHIDALLAADATKTYLSPNPTALGSAHNVRHSYPFAGDNAHCSGCDNEMQEVRPGKLQCPVCE